jgi:Fe-S-cluster containining protein
VVIETDLKYIEEIAAEGEDENWEFRTFLKQLDMATEEIDAIVHQITDEVTSQIDCTKCANCCKQIRPVLDKDDISEFALGFKMSVSQVKEKYLGPADDDPSKYMFNELPCPILKDNLCTNYECRPKDCRSYPNLHKEDFVSRLWGVVENYSVCPIVFNVYERLKAELWHYDEFDDGDFGYEWMF